MKRNYFLYTLLLAALLLSGCTKQQNQTPSKEALPPSNEAAADNSTDGSSILTAEEAKALALAKVPGAAADHIQKFETDFDDGRTEYEGEIFYNGVEYEFEIDAATGNFLSWETDYDD